MKEVLLVGAGGLVAWLGSLLAYWLEMKRFRVTDAQQRLQELIDRLREDRQYLRSSAVSGLADYAVANIEQTNWTSDATARYFVTRPLSQLAVMLHTEPDGAVQDELRRAAIRIAEAAIRRDPRWVKFIWPYLENSFWAARRWAQGAVGRLATITPDADRPFVLEALGAYAWHLGLDARIIPEFLTESQATSLQQWYGARLTEHDRVDDGKYREHASDCLNRYATCCRVLVAVAGLAQSAHCEVVQVPDHGFVAPETDLKFGTRWRRHELHQVPVAEASES